MCTPWVYQCWPGVLDQKLAALGGTLWEFQSLTVRNPKRVVSWRSLSVPRGIRHCHESGLENTLSRRDVQT
jgi:hypothetical protein